MADLGGSGRILPNGMPTSDLRWNDLGQPVRPEVVPKKSRLVARASVDVKPGLAVSASSAKSLFPEESLLHSQVVRGSGAIRRALMADPRHR